MQVALPKPENGSVAEPYDIFNWFEPFCLFFDARMPLGKPKLFFGTLTQTSVYPREIVKKALAWNAAAVILAHNHPSGVAEPSQADQMLTETLKRALDLVDVKVLDHFVIGDSIAMSFAERGLV